MQRAGRGRLHRRCRRARRISADWIRDGGSRPDQADSPDTDQDPPRLYGGLNTASFNMGRLVAAGAICEQEAAAALIEQGQRIGLEATECERTVASGISAGMEQPRESRSVSPSLRLLIWLYILSTALLAAAQWPTCQTIAVPRESSPPAGRLQKI
jgi:hypothetical protein